MKKKIIIVIIMVFVVVAAIFFFASKINQKTIHHSPTTIQEPSILYYTCGMHPSVKISPDEYNKGQVNCPICNMKLIPVYSQESEESQDSAYYGCGMEGAKHVFLIQEERLKNCPICSMPLKKLSKQEADKLKGVVGRVKIKSEQVQLVGVKTEFVRKIELYKEIRTVGKVAYDPELVIAQEEFISSLKALEKIQGGDIPEIKERAAHLVESSRRKLRLLGLSLEQIKEMEEKREVQTSLILPEEKMWIYGNAYEYELPWVKTGVRVKVTTSSLPGEEFHGVIASMNPVLDPKTRSVTFRAEVDNQYLQLKPEMYVDVIIMSTYVSSQGEQMVLAIPKNAVLDTGVRKVVWVDKGAGEYEGREVIVGPEAVAVIDGKKTKLYPILRGLLEGESVVTKANFLIDSQSQLSGVAASAYGGALGAQEQEGQAETKGAPAGHQH